MRRTIPVSLLTAVLYATTSQADDPLTRDEIMGVFGADINTAEITAQPLRGNLHALFGVGGNILVSTGQHGVMIVDDQFPELTAKYQATIRELGGGDVDFVVNTHWHFDHADGNEKLGEQGSWIVAHSNSRSAMTEDRLINMVALSYMQKAYREAGIPVITFDDRMQFHFNGERIDLLHFGPAHTTGDAAVVFRGNNVVHMGDVYNNSGYPFIDADNGGDINGMIRFCEAMLGELNDESIVVPGHGPVVGYAELAAYVAMLKTVRDRISTLIASGASLEEIVAAKPTADWDEVKGNPAGFINRVYTSLTRPTR